MGRTLQPTWEFIFIEVSFRIAPLLQAPFHTHSLKGSQNSSRYSSSRRFSKSSYHSSRRLSQSSISILSLLIQNIFVLILVSPSLRNILGPNKIPSYSSWYLRRCGISSGLTKIPSYSSWYLRRCGISSGLPKYFFVLVLVSPSLWNFLGSHQNSFVLIFGSPSLRNFLGSHQNSFVLPLSCVEHHEIASHLNEVFKYPNSVSRALQSSPFVLILRISKYLRVSILKKDFYFSSFLSKYHHVPIIMNHFS